jgi:hypothetical protein
MISRNILFAALLIGLTGNAMAGDETNMTMAIKVVGEDSAHGKHFMINSNDFGFDLAEMQVGESRSIVDESGRNILVTRAEDGFSINIDGETIELPDFDGAVHGGMHVTAMNEMSGTMILSPKPIDGATQQAIKSLLESAGYGSDVNFIDHDGAEHGKVMIRKVEM